MNIKIDYLENKTIINIDGRLDTQNAPDFEKKIQPVLESKMQNVILECNDLEYISSSGLRIFLTMQKKANSNKGELTILNMKKDIKNVFDMTGFTSLFNIK